MQESPVPSHVREVNFAGLGFIKFIYTNYTTNIHTQTDTHVKAAFYFPASASWEKMFVQLFALGLAGLWPKGPFSYSSPS